MHEIMLFPLSSFVLPEGRMRLRIFEPRYKRLVAQALKSDGTFGICLFDSTEAEVGSQLSRFGTQVKIVDFEQLEDGILGISVTGLTKFELYSLRVEYDGLRVAMVDNVASWPLAQVSAKNESIALHLHRIYQRFPELSDLYEQKFFDDASWVAQRWLEILPMSNRQFDQLMAQPDCSEALLFLNDTLKNLRLSELN